MSIRKNSKEKNISLRPERVCEILGININRKEIPLLLERLDFTVAASSKKNSSSFTVTVPLFRPDIEREIDLIEEVTRMYGYDNIPAQNKATVHFSESAPAIEMEDRLRSMLIGSGMNEIVANSMQQKDIALLGSSDIVGNSQSHFKRYGCHADGSGTRVIKHFEK